MFTGKLFTFTLMIRTSFSAKSVSVLCMFTMHATQLNFPHHIHNFTSFLFIIRLTYYNMIALIAMINVMSLGNCHIKWCIVRLF